MDVQFIGPLGKVTGSCTWMRDIEKGWSFLIDCGMQQGENSAEDWNSGAAWPFDPREIQFVALTHAHIDHSGLIPELYRQGFKGQVYCTTPTRKLSQVLLADAARLPGTPYQEADIMNIDWKDDRIKSQGGYTPVATDLFLRFFRSGHIVGASSISVVWGAPGTEQKSIVFSGDVGPGAEDHETLPFLRFPLHPKPGNFAVVESTYGNVVRPDCDADPKHRRAHLTDLIDRTIQANGTLAIAAFSVGRTQDILFDLHHIVATDPEKYHSVQFLLDSPMACKINAITLEALTESTTSATTKKVRPAWLGKQLFRELGLHRHDKQGMKDARAICRMTLNFKDTVEDCKIQTGNSVARNWRPIFAQCADRSTHLKGQIQGPRVIVFSSGTCDGGPATQWLPHLLQSDRNIIALSGFAPPNSIGGQLLALKEVPVDQRQLHMSSILWKTPDGAATHGIDICDIEAHVTAIHGYSAHADQKDLVNWVFEDHLGHTKQAMGQTVFLNHGTTRAASALQDALKNRAQEWQLQVDVVTPPSGQGWINLDSHRSVDMTSKLQYAAPNPVQACRANAA